MCERFYMSTKDQDVMSLNWSVYFIVRSEVGPKRKKRLEPISEMTLRYKFEYYMNIPQTILLNKIYIRGI